MEKLRAAKGKVYIENNWEKLRSMELQEKQADYGKHPIISLKNKKFDSKKHPLLEIRKNDKKSVKQTMKKQRRTRYHDL